MSLRIPFDTLKSTLQQVFLNAGLSAQTAEVCATIHAQSSADGIESHGLNRVPLFVTYVQRGWIDVAAQPTVCGAKGAVENYDGHLGIGITNALFCADRAVELAKLHGIGCVALKHSTHWMRGGTYALRMADAGFMGMNWISTESCMPLWGSDEPSVGNNPFCIGIPRASGAVVLDMAMSQYAYGKLGVYQLANKQLPYPGGYDAQGNLTTDPATIEQTRRILPVGYWKGSGMALALDMAAALMANGKTGAQLDEEARGSCTNCSQIFIAYDPYLFGEKEEIQEMLDHRIACAAAAHPAHAGGAIAYPGQRSAATRAQSMAQGVVVNETVWQEVCALAAR